MTKGELLKKIEKDESSIDSWGIALGYLSNAGFILGCYFDQKENSWKIYDTDERGIEAVFFRADSEEEAYDKLYELVIFHKKLSTRRF